MPRISEGRKRIKFSISRRESAGFNVYGDGTIDMAFPAHWSEEDEAKWLMRLETFINESLEFRMHVSA